MHPNEIPVYETLDRLGIGYKRIAHPAAATIEQCESITGESGAKHCKNLFLTNRSATAFFLVMLRRDKLFKTAVVSKQLNVSRLSFAGEQQLMEILSLRQGSVSVAGLINDVERTVKVAIDGDLMEQEYILIHPNTNTASIEICTRDVLKLLDALGYVPQIIRI